jgi:hypothetical protein
MDAFVKMSKKRPENCAVTMASEICSISFGCDEEVAMFARVVKGSDGGGETIFRASILRLSYIRVLGGLCSSGWVVYCIISLSYKKNLLRCVP